MQRSFLTREDFRLRTTPEIETWTNEDDVSVSLGLTDKTDTVTNAEERRIVEQLWQEIRPLYRLIHAYVRQQMSRIYPGLLSPNEPIPIHLTSEKCPSIPFDLRFLTFFSVLM